MSTTQRAAVVLAAGKGTRLRSTLPKVLHQAAGRSLLASVVDSARQAGCERIYVVVGHQADRVKEAFADQDDLVWVLQEEQRGTGHALAQVAGVLEGSPNLLVLSGDAPVIAPETLRALAEAAEAGWGSLATAHLDEPGSLGRVLAGPDGAFESIVEAADASEEVLRVQRVNAGFYAFPAAEIFTFLESLDASNAQGELYLTDAVTAAAAAGRRIELVELADPAEALGVNTRRDLARVHRQLVRRHLGELMDGGVTILDPDRTEVELDVCIGPDTVLHPGVSLRGNTRIGAGCVLEQGAWLRDCELGDGVRIEPYSVLDGAQVGNAGSVGPFARLRPASVLLDGARVGNFVEVKNARLGAGSKAGHLAYLGDAQLGDGVNVGAGVITCNYDGVAKHRTTVGDRAFLGSDTMLVAPLEVGADATTAAGSVVTQDVPERALAVGRARQRNVAGWAERRRKPSASEGEKGS